MQIHLRKFLAAVLTIVLLSVPLSFGAVPIDTGSDYVEGAAAFSVEVDGRVISHNIMTVTVMPGETVDVTVQADSTSSYHFDAPGELIESISPGVWRFTAPEQPGLHTFNITNNLTGASIRLQTIVLTPWQHNGEDIDGYRIGRYQEAALRGMETYERPRGFIKVTEENKDLRLSPNFRLEQFLCKQTDALPQYVLVRTRLLERLERILAGVNEMGHQVSTLHIMSGYRTPYYNRSIGNTTEYSRHLYGDAADIFVDADGDNEMDDLNGDGRVTEADARLLAKLVDDKASAEHDQFPGGMGIYGPASHRGPFVHVDLRGYQARW